MIISLKNILLSLFIYLFLKLKDILINQIKSKNQSSLKLDHILFKKKVKFFCQINYINTKAGLICILTRNEKKKVKMC